VSILLPHERTGTVRAAKRVEIHGDRWVDLAVEFDDAPGAPLTGRVAAGECPDGIAPGDRVRARFVMGLMTRVERA
jgi:hypothetical protein